MMLGLCVSPPDMDKEFHHVTAGELLNKVKIALKKYIVGKISALKTIFK